MNTELENEIKLELVRLHKKWGLIGTIEMSGGFYMNYAQLGVNNSRVPIKRKQTWAEFFNREIGMIPKAEGDWAKVFQHTSLLPPSKYSSLRERIKRESKFFVPEQDLEGELDQIRVRQPNSRLTRSQMAHDLIKALRINEWFDENKKEKWERFNFSQRGSSIKAEKFVILVGRGFGYELIDELMDRFGIILELRPNRPEVFKTN